MNKEKEKNMIIRAIERKPDTPRSSESETHFKAILKTMSEAGRKALKREGE